MSSQMDAVLKKQSSLAAFRSPIDRKATATLIEVFIFDSMALECFIPMIATDSSIDAIPELTLEMASLLAFILSLSESRIVSAVTAFIPWMAVYCTSSRRVARISCDWLCAQNGTKLHRNAVYQSSEAADVARAVFLVGEEHLGKTDGSHSGQNGPDSYILKDEITVEAMSKDTFAAASDRIFDTARANATIDASI